MLKTMRAELNKGRADAAMEGMIIDATLNAQIRDVVLEGMDCDEDECDPEEQGEMGSLIDSIPETEIDDDYDAYIEGDVNAKDELGDEKKMKIEDVAEAYIPITEEV